MGSLLITSLYAAPLGVMAIGLSTHVTMQRVKTGISIMDGGNMQLAERIRRHGNFTETVPLTLILMMLAELGGTAPIWLHLSGALLVSGRILHAAGLKHDYPKSPLRIVGTLATTIAGVIMICNILAIALLR